ncbi:MAG: cycloartenol synthase [Verrucomicrobiaceae bacterium]|nr:MAG: cycloartenol synthase [Verrucomicrobiaceae bacterium]
MMTRRQFTATAIAACSFTPNLRAQGDVSLKNEVQAAIDKGLKYLKSRQDAATGSIGDSAYPAMTALAAMAIMGNPGTDADKAPAEAVKAYDFLLSQQKPDGGIFATALPNYNTALCLSALTMINGERYREAGIRARRPLISFQSPESGDATLEGGIGYGNKPSADLSNTHFALEALHLSKKLLADDPDRAKKEPQLNYAAAIKFVSRCQNLAATNDQSWVSEDPKNKGGFVYKPGDSKAGTDDLADGKKAVRSYGSMGYAGLLAFIYSEVKAGDQRVTAVREWLSKNYTVTENPGIGQEGLFYYYHTMAKALGLSRTERVELADGKQANWRLDLARQLFNFQGQDGSFTNPNGRWMEKNPDLTTSYATLALEHIIRGL